MTGKMPVATKAFFFAITFGKFHEQHCWTSQQWHPGEDFQILMS
jgi:hypothetical protein